MVVTRISLKGTRGGGCVACCRGVCEFVASTGSWSGFSCYAVALVQWRADNEHPALVCTCTVQRLHTPCFNG